MTETFDPYLQWLGIPKEEQPPDYYQLLGIGRFESDSNVIANAADRQMTYLRTVQMGRHASLSQQILNELSEAKYCLLDAGQKAVYDARLRKHLSAAQMPALSPTALDPTPAPMVRVQTEPITEKLPKTFIPVWTLSSILLVLIVGFLIAINLSGDGKNDPKGGGRVKTKTSTKSSTLEKNEVLAIAQRPDGKVILPADYATVHGPAIKKVTRGGQTYITYWINQDDWVTWDFVINKGQRGVFKVTLEYACPEAAEGGKFMIEVGKEKLTGTGMIP